jgi:hypothetical protein
MQLCANIIRPAWLRQEHEVSRNVTDPFATCRDEDLDPRPAEGRHAGKFNPIQPAREFKVRENDPNIGCMVVQKRKRVLCSCSFRPLGVDLVNRSGCHAANIGIGLNDEDHGRWRARSSQVIGWEHNKPTPPLQRGFSLA